jgi:hypothetical protein
MRPSGLVTISSRGLPLDWKAFLCVADSNWLLEFLQKFGVEQHILEVQDSDVYKSSQLARLRRSASLHAGKEL